jgi:Zn-dependent protease with chaperone function
MKKTILLALFITTLMEWQQAPAQPADSIQSDSIIIQDTTAQTAGAIEMIKPAETAIADTIYPITPERRAMLNKYSNFKLGWSVFYDVLNWALLLIVAFSGASFALLKLAKRLSGKNAVQFLLYLLFIMVVLTIITLPFDIYRDYVVEHQYNLSNQTFGAWLGDWAKAFPIGYIVAAIAAAFIYFLLRKFPRRWWLLFSTGAIPFVIFLIVIVPVVVMPMFNKFEPLKDEQLKTEILTLAGKAGIEGADVFQVDASKQSSKLNAYVTGLFGTKRIVLYDTIIGAMSREELMFVMAHEMGHYVMHHVWVIVAMVILLLLFSTYLIARFLPAIILKYQKRLGFDSITSYASMPLILLAISFVSFFVQPITNGVARSFEHAADKYGMEMTNYNGAAAKVAFEKLSAYNLSDPDPNAFVEFWFYDHPALWRRIKFVEKTGKN